PQLREHHAGAMLIEPLQLGAAEQENAAQHEFGDRGRMRLGVRERERATPRPAEHEPALDTQALPQALHVGHEVPGGVRYQRGVWQAPTGTALVEYDNPVSGGIKESPRVRVATGAGPAMHEHGGLALRVAALLVVDLVAV